MEAQQSQRHFSMSSIAIIVASCHRHSICHGMLMKLNQRRCSALKWFPGPVDKIQPSHGTHHFRNQLFYPPRSGIKGGHRLRVMSRHSQHRPQVLPHRKGRPAEVCSRVLA